MLRTEDDRVDESEYGEVDRGETKDDSREKSSSVLSRESGASESGILSSLPQLRLRSIDGEAVLGSSGDCGCTKAGGVGGSLRIASCVDPRSIVWQRCAGSIGRICGRAGAFPFSCNAGKSSADASLDGIVSGGLESVCSIAMAGVGFGSGGVSLIGVALAGFVLSEMSPFGTGAGVSWFVAARASSPISISTGFALMTFFFTIFTTFSPSCSPSVDISDDDFVTVLRTIFFTILFTFTGGGEVANEGFSSSADFPFSTTPFVTVGPLEFDCTGFVSVLDSTSTMGTPFVIGFGFSIGFALQTVDFNSSSGLGPSNFTSLLFSSSVVFTFFS